MYPAVMGEVIRYWADCELEKLVARFPAWDVWYVKFYPNDLVWCARPKGTPVSTVRAGSPEVLTEAIVLAG